MPFFTSLGVRQRSGDSRLGAALRPLRALEEQLRWRGWMGGKMSLPTSPRTAPHPPPWTIRRLGPRLRTPERHLSSLEARAAASAALLRPASKAEGSSECHGHRWTAAPQMRADLTFDSARTDRFQPLAGA